MQRHNQVSEYGQGCMKHCEAITWGKDKEEIDHEAKGLVRGQVCRVRLKDLPSF